MIPSVLSFTAIVYSLFISVVYAAPTHSLQSRWGWPECTAENIRTRVDFASMEPCDRKAYTDAVRCLMEQPSQLDPTIYPAAINKYFDYAVVHVNRTALVHLSGFFSTWHRYFLWLYEEDLRQTCGYTGAFPYWNFAATADDIHNNPVFDGSEFSMSGDGLPNNTGPIVLGPALTIPHGTGGGCVYSGPFANMTTTLALIDPSVLLEGTPLSPTAFDLSPGCLVRDLNAYVAQTYTNWTELISAVYSPSASDFEYQLNGVIGSSSLGIHSGAHFEIGGQMDSIHVSPQDPIWYPLHTMIDLVYTSWQIQNPQIASTLSGTGTALNIPPSPNVTLDTIEPDWGYFQLGPIQVSELVSTTSGPFCYQYDVVLG
jgi:tyrosinase